jgi:hypothetical protein
MEFIYIFGAAHAKLGEYFMSIEGASRNVKRNVF